MSAIFKDTAKSLAIGMGFGVVVVGGIAYMIPRSLPTQSSVENVAADLILGPVNIAANVGTKIGDSVMRAAGYTYTPDELVSVNAKNWAMAYVPHTPAYSARRLQNIMHLPGRVEELEALRIEILGSNDLVWNKDVADAYFVMFKRKLQTDLDNYV